MIVANCYMNRGLSGALKLGPGGLRGRGALSKFLMGPVCDNGGLKFIPT